MRYELSQEEEIPILMAWLEDPEILRWFPMINTLEVEDACKVWIGYYGKQFGSAFTVFSGEEIVGFFNFYLAPVQKLKHQTLFSIIVHPNYRGKGIGRQILEEIKVRAKRDFQIEILHLEVYKENPARKLYLSVGFEEYGVHKNFLKEADGTYRDKILMQQWL
ncbi:MAG: GNAT family N-acetyltransferase [Chlamydiia bacterium]